MRLIDADDLEKLFREVIGRLAKEPVITKDVEHMIRASAMTIEMIKDAPTVDAVTVVRCRDCKHYLGLAECEFEGHFSGGTDYFCSYGEAKIKKIKNFGGAGEDPIGSC